ncbi:zinc c3hc4 type (ring finger) domain-containing protein [Cystoisospora suis]|uniref:Zinc c3hc4 type (Ring finger) domain-containing protein n=1 Tax=Cystoisospora suis TaxID=483139 RepID=A0A2C6KZU1_9APIC|nr:zinc c3hc4 type (ring finger) domain-containing protein [Cystoisospora suis]
MTEGEGGSLLDGRRRGGEEEGVDDDDDELGDIFTAVQLAEELSQDAGENASRPVTPLSRERNCPSTPESVGSGRHTADTVLSVQTPEYLRHVVSTPTSAVRTPQTGHQLSTPPTVRRSTDPSPLMHEGSSALGNQSSQNPVITNCASPSGPLSRGGIASRQRSGESQDRDDGRRSRQTVPLVTEARLLSPLRQPRGCAQTSRHAGRSARTPEHEGRGLGTAERGGRSWGTSEHEGQSVGIRGQGGWAVGTPGPSVGTPAHGGPSVGTPEHGRPSVGTPRHGGPSVGTPGRGGPRVGTPGRGGPCVGTPGRGNPSVGTPGRGNPSVGTPRNGEVGATDSQSSPEHAVLRQRDERPSPPEVSAPRVNEPFELEDDLPDFFDAPLPASGDWNDFLALRVRQEDPQRRRDQERGGQENSSRLSARDCSQLRLSLPLLPSSSSFPSTPDASAERHPSSAVIPTPTALSQNGVPIAPPPSRPRLSPPFIPAVASVISSGPSFSSLTGRLEEEDVERVRQRPLNRRDLGGSILLGRSVRSSSVLSPAPVRSGFSSSSTAADASVNSPSRQLTSSLLSTEGGQGKANPLRTHVGKTPGGSRSRTNHHLATRPPPHLSVSLDDYFSPARRDASSPSQRQPDLSSVEASTVTSSPRSSSSSSAPPVNADDGGASSDHTITTSPEALVPSPSHSSSSAPPRPGSSPPRSAALPSPAHDDPSSSSSTTSSAGLSAFSSSSDGSSSSVPQDLSRGGSSKAAYPPKRRRGRSSSEQEEGDGSSSETTSRVGARANHTEASRSRGRRTSRLLYHLQKEETCAVCLARLDIAKETASIEDCSHAFCEGCITLWIHQGRDTCPLCRGSVTAILVWRQGPPPKKKKTKEGCPSFLPSSSSLPSSFSSSASSSSSTCNNNDVAPVRVSDQKTALLESRSEGCTESTSYFSEDTVSFVFKKRLTRQGNKFKKTSSPTPAEVTRISRVTPASGGGILDASAAARASPMTPVLGPLDYLLRGEARESSRRRRTETSTATDSHPEASVRPSSSDRPTPPPPRSSSSLTSSHVLTVPGPPPPPRPSLHGNTSRRTAVTTSSLSEQRGELS